MYFINFLYSEGKFVSCRTQNKNWLNIAECLYNKTLNMILLILESDFGIRSVVGMDER